LASNVAPKPANRSRRKRNFPLIAHNETHEYVLMKREVLNALVKGPFSLHADGAAVRQCNGYRHELTDASCICSNAGTDDLYRVKVQ